MNSAQPAQADQPKSQILFHKKSLIMFFKKRANHRTSIKRTLYVYAIALRSKDPLSAL